MKRIFSILLIVTLYISQTAFSVLHPVPAKNDIEKSAEALLKKQILAEAGWAMKQKPVTVTAASSPRSAGGKHDFFSEADYFWPDPAHPDGPYINRDGLTNPDNLASFASIIFPVSMSSIAFPFPTNWVRRWVPP